MRESFQTTPLTGIRDALFTRYQVLTMGFRSKRPGDKLVRLHFEDVQIMGDYFKPWRRKVGVMTLVLACVFTVGWIRSFNRIDVITAPWITFISGCGQYRVLPTPYASEDVSYGPNDSLAFVKLSFRVDIPRSKEWNWRQWRTNKAKFVVAVGDAGDMELRIGMFSYLWIVVPYSLLSAWLLLSKPREKSATR